MPSGSRWTFKRLFTANGSCGGCSQKATDAVQPQSRRQICRKRSEVVAGCARIHDGIAVVKVSDDPCRDFRQSMVAMISENEIRSKDDLLQLLRCFLELNPRHHHEAIVKAFTEIWIGGAGNEEATPSSSSSSENE